ncbi:hypothetical protein M441DRAFT_78540 [Trichoderma asperellum CBS 433.97]|uniref:BTB domain-containing protein n=1 Tax=Trichoderma asperellum (strain ATCC 204424 / CBS 433.97 / NBRC 101777) TaxID=1042311 RepID=A0A2T3ZFI2_TRIA4|nr:hypothetical protein M441DRAFT_78540 [Trichoderma asperellum CBS 433.97]PTB43549.1 hypothetical protein M441DRAFT_78540 [Trichoderma asperellum CBS 433.97]
MNSIRAEIIASSPPFRFLVGPNQREFTIYSALFAHQSPVFEKLVNGNFSESTEKCVQWKSVDEDTFICFWQYTHTGRYTAASPVIGLKSESEATCAPPPPRPPSPGLTSLFGGPVAAKKDETPPKELTKREIQWNEFKNQRASAYSGAFCSAGLFGPCVRSNYAHEDYTNNFILHARVYVFAECYGIAGLMDLSLNELHGTLVRFTLYKERINDVVALIRYCYENLVPEPLREVVALYTACKLEKLWLSEEFHALVETYGELSKTLFGLIVKVL